MGDGSLKHSVKCGPQRIETETSESPLHLSVIKSLHEFELPTRTIQPIPCCPVLLNLLGLGSLHLSFLLFFDLLESFLLPSQFFPFIPPHETSTIDSQDKVHLLGCIGVRVSSQPEVGKLSIMTDQVMPVIINFLLSEDRVEHPERTS